MPRTPLKQISYTMGCRNQDGFPLYILGSYYESKRKARQALQKERQWHPGAFLVKVTEERIPEEG